MSHAEELHHHTHHIHHPNHRHAIPLRPILHRRETSHLGRQPRPRSQSRVRYSTRRNSDASRRSDDRFANVMAAVSQAREQIREYERESQIDAHSPTRRPRSGSFGISTRVGEGNANNNLDRQHGPVYLPQTRHVPGTPHPRAQHQLQEENSYLSVPTQPEPQRPPSPSNHSHPVSAPDSSMNFHPYHTMSSFPMAALAPGQFFQQTPHGPSPFVVPTPLMPMSGLVPTPFATSQTLPPSWAPTTPQASSAYVSTPATSMYNLQPGAPAGMMAYPSQQQSFPTMSPAAFWSTPAPAAVPLTPVMSTPLTPGQTVGMTGGLPLSGALPFWTSVESWPPRERTLPLHLAPWLAPNPVNPERPHVMWDVSEPPSTAKRLSGKDVIVDMRDAFSSDATAVFPETDEILVVCNLGLGGQDMWPPIRIRKHGKVTSGDVFWAIYEFFQTPITCDEVDIIRGRSEDDYRRLLDGCYRRCKRTPGLADITRRQGLKRVDCLEDRTTWWGMVPVWGADGSWSLHLGLMASPRA